MGLPSSLRSPLTDLSFIIIIFVTKRFVIIVVVVVAVVTPQPERLWGIVIAFAGRAGGRAAAAFLFQTISQQPLAAEA